MDNKEKIDIFGKTIVHEDTIKTVKRQFCGFKEWEEISANYLFEEGLIYRTHEELLPLNNKNNSKMSKGLNRHFPKEDIQVANKDTKRHPTSLVIINIQIKTK